MSADAEFNPYRAPSAPASAPVERGRAQSRLGIASFVIGVVALLLLIAGPALAFFRAAQNAPQSDPIFRLVEILIVAGAVLALLGFGLGVACLLQRRRRRAWGVAGVILNVAPLFLIVAMFAAINSWRL